MNRAAREKLVAEGAEVLRKLNQEGFSILVRTETMECVGIISKKTRLFEKTIMEHRLLLEGISAKEKGTKVIKEYSDWFNPKSGELEDCTLTGQGNVIMTMRNNSSSEDDPNNFTWLSYQESAYFQKLQDENGLLRTQTEDLVNQSKKFMDQRDDAKRDAELTRLNSRKNENKVDKAHKELIEVKAELENLKELIPEYVAGKHFDKAKGEQIVKDAKKHGKLDGMSDLDRARKELDDYRRYMESAQRVSKSDTKAFEKLETAVGLISTKIEGIESDVKDVKSTQISSAKSAASPSGK